MIFLCCLCEKYFSKLAVSMCIQCAKQQIFFYFWFFTKPGFEQEKKSFPPFSPKRLDRSGWNFFYVYCTQIGVRVFFSFKNTKYILQEKQNTEDTVKNPSFFDGTNFLRPAKFYRNDISKQKKKHAPRFGWSTRKKNFSPIGPAVSEKKGENFFLLLKNWFREKHKIKKTFASSFFVFFFAFFFAFFCFFFHSKLQ